ncbi:hypothetical protein [Nonomuraea ceibae]|uniref:hypothetical protein n=1 Tax=Nonomuraea ceibae TaxID=1935170 RepID=UPI001C5EF653|nr:hypothetical protein [Nonomuraea ceibae]
MPRLFPFTTKQPAPTPTVTDWDDELRRLLPPPPTVLRTHVITRQYSPRSRRALRRMLLAAEARGLRATVKHDHSHLFRLNLLTITGLAPAINAFRRRLDHVRPAVKPWWSR